ncbi:MAG TPA: glycosyltransferase [Nitrospiraceae bacterium]|nr:glycosyltransferase [Nitrospiraceae bacterium]
MVSVVIPAYNEEKALPNTLRALFTQQGDFEVITVDGGSTDRTRTIVESFGFIDGASDRSGLSLVSRRSSGASRDTLHVSRFMFAHLKVAHLR